MVSFSNPMSSGLEIVENGYKVKGVVLLQPVGRGIVSLLEHVVKLELN